MIGHNLVLCLYILVKFLLLQRSLVGLVFLQGQLGIIMENEKERHNLEKPRRWLMNNINLYPEEIG
jgi:hypothetical protein